jgi:hypothetical protein
MVENPTILASRSAHRSASRTWLAEDFEWYFLPAAERLLLAHVAGRSAAVENRLSLLSLVAVPCQNP